MGYKRAKNKIKQIKHLTKEKQNVELQSRREFFKKAAKTAMPAVGAIVMASLPSNLFATNSTSCKGCTGGCAGGCSSCTGTCSGSCKATSTKS